MMTEAERRKARLIEQKTRIEFDDSAPDRLGRRHFTLVWEEPKGVFRPEPSKTDGKPVGYRRAQCFFAKPEEYGFDHGGELL